MSDGQLYGVKSYVKASGGCSAPAASNADAAKSTLGQMKFRAFPPVGDALPEAQIMLRHPQNSGLQMDQVTRLYVPPFFVETLEVWQGDDLVLALDGGIAISEDPNLRFNYRPKRLRELPREGASIRARTFSKANGRLRNRPSDHPQCVRYI